MFLICCVYLLCVCACVYIYIYIYIHIFKNTNWCSLHSVVRHVFAVVVLLLLCLCVFACMCYLLVALLFICNLCMLVNCLFVLFPVTYLRLGWYVLLAFVLAVFICWNVCLLYLWWCSYLVLYHNWFFCIWMLTLIWSTCLNTTTYCFVLSTNMF